MKLRWSALFFAAFVACDRPATQIVVRVDSDMREGEELRAVRVTLRRVGADRDTYDETFDLTQGTLRLPGTVGVVPGDPDASIMVCRMSVEEPKWRMPPLGSLVVHQEGLALMREWIASLDPTLCEPAP